MWLLINRRILAAKFWGGSKSHEGFDWGDPCAGDSALFRVHCASLFRTVYFFLSLWRWVVSLVGLDSSTGFQGLPLLPAVVDSC